MGKDIFPRCPLGNVGDETSVDEFLPGAKVAPDFPILDKLKNVDHVSGDRTKLILPILCNA
jgi:hypothetical protein